MQQTATWNCPAAGKTRVAELLELFGCTGVLLNVLHNAPPSDRHMIAAVTASASLLVATGALVLLA